MSRGGYLLLYWGANNFPNANACEPNRSQVITDEGLEISH